VTLLCHERPYRKGATSNVPAPPDCAGRVTFGRLREPRIAPMLRHRVGTRTRAPGRNNACSLESSRRAKFLAPARLRAACGPLNQLDLQLSSSGP